MKQNTKKKKKEQKSNAINMRYEYFPLFFSLTPPLAPGTLHGGLTTSETDTAAALASGAEHGGVPVR